MANVEHWNGIGSAMDKLRAQYYLAIVKANENGNKKLEEELRRCWQNICIEDSSALQAICDLQD